MKRVLVVHMWGLGDWLFFSPVVKALVDQHPGVVVDVIVGTPSVAPLISLYQGVRVVGVANVRRRPWKIVALTIARLCHRYDALVFTAGVDTRKADILSAFVRAKKKVALVRRKPLILREYERLNQAEHAVVQNQRIAQMLGLRVNDPYPNIPLPREVEPVLRSVLIHPGCDSKNSFKRWPVERFASVASELLQGGWTVSILLGPDEEWMEASFDTLRGHERFAVRKGLALPEACAVIAAHEVVLSSDSGIGHVAAALKRKCITLIGPGDPARVRPWTEAGRIIRTAKPPQCMPCMRPGGKYGCAEQPCMTGIQVSDVLKVVRDAGYGDRKFS